MRWAEHVKQIEHIKWKNWKMLFGKPRNKLKNHITPDLQKNVGFFLNWIGVSRNNVQIYGHANVVTKHRAWRKVGNTSIQRLLSLSRRAVLRGLVRSTIFIERIHYLRFSNSNRHRLDKTPHFSSRDKATSSPLSRSSSRFGQAYQINAEACLFRGEFRLFWHTRRHIQPFETCKEKNSLKSNGLMITW